MRKGVNKSAKIQSLIESNPEITANEIVERLGKEKITVSKPLIYKALSNAKSGVVEAKPKSPGRPKGSKNAVKENGKKRGRKPGPKLGSARANATSAATNTTQDLFTAAQQFVTASGSLDKAIEILSVFKR